MGQLQEGISKADSPHVHNLLIGHKTLEPIRHESFWRERLDEYSQKLETDRSLYNLQQRGLCLRKLRQYDEALEDLDEALEIDGGDKSVLNDRGLTKSMMRDFVGAIADFSAALALDGEYASALFNRAAAYLFRKKAPEAKADFDVLVRLGTAELEAASEVAAAAPDDEAVQKKLKEGERNLCSVYKKRAIAQKKLKAFDEALQDLDRAVELNGSEETPDVQKLRAAIMKKME